LKERKQREVMAMGTTATNGGVDGLKDKESMVDPFLVEALQNPRHRLTSQYYFVFNLVYFLGLKSRVSNPNFDLI
jgi:coenzyme F420-reducing hydrogenase gamma subunit